MADAGRILALDFGAARTGVAISDPSGTIAQPLDHVERANSEAGLARIGELVREHGVARIVVGLPVGLRGETPQTARARSFADRLRRALGDAVPVELYDERFTTRLADSTARASGSETSRDSLAASHLLASWLEARHRD